MTIFTQSQIEEVRRDMTKRQQDEDSGKKFNLEPIRPVRFLVDGRAINLSTGELCRKGSNVMYHPVYWRYWKSLADKIANWIGAEPVFSDE